jgi:hypothetical protein
MSEKNRSEIRVEPWLPAVTRAVLHALELNLSLIHLIVSKGPSGVYMLQALHQRIKLLGARRSTRELFQPIAKRGI